MRSCRIVSSLAALAALCCLAPLTPRLEAQTSNFQINQVTGGLSQPVGVTGSGDGSGRLFIVEQAGRIKVWSGSQVLPTLFLDVTSLVSFGPCSPSCGERGLLGLAFHPDFEINDEIYIFYTRTDGDLVVARYNVFPSDSNVVDPSTADIILIIEHSAESNHNGGQIAFGPDGYLYVGTGDGGGTGDPFENGQNIETLLGKILRLDVDFDDFPGDADKDYAIPTDNPFADDDGADEVWAYGLRNPWRFSFDRQNSDLYIADVGQGDFEEVNFQDMSSFGGENYGWDCREAAHDYTDPNGDLNADCTGTGYTEPVLEYDHSDGTCAVTGGFAYRGRVNSILTGDYVFGDFCSGDIWSAEEDGGDWTRTDLQDTSHLISSFGEGDTGRIYYTDLNGTLQWFQPYTFGDVPPTHPFWRFAEALFLNGVTSGCGNGNYCPAGATTRGAMAVFLLKAQEGPAYTPPACTTQIFNDVPCSNPLAPWINELSARNVTAGCGNGNYCPNSAVGRGAMAVFLLRTLEGPSYTPPVCTTPTFADVPCSNPLAPWVDEIAARGITAGCGGGNYCPNSPVSRGQMAVFLSVTFNLVETAP
jgi:glucose/arabinose dehydrogenase